jgi:hypothetical protein
VNAFTQYVHVRRIFVTRIRQIGRAGEQVECGTNAAATMQRSGIPANQSTDVKVNDLGSRQ